MRDILDRWVRPMDNSGHKVPDDPRDLVTWFLEPLERLRSEAAARFGSRFAAVSPLKLLTALEKHGFLDQKLAAEYRGAYHRIRFAAGNGVDTGECAQLRDALAGALPAAEALQELKIEASLEQRDAAEATAGSSGLAHTSTAVRPGWTRPPVVWDSAAGGEDQADGGGTAGEQSAQEKASVRRRAALFTLGILFLLVWTGGTAAATYVLRHRITAVLWKWRYGRDYPGGRRSLAEQRSQLEQLMDDYGHKELTEEERGALAAQIARLAFERDLFLLAEHYYRAALERNPTDAELLNELAWMLLTRGEPWFQDVLQGYRLARRAVQLAPRPHIKDTLAEAYYLMGQYREAVELEKEVLSEATEQRDFYRRQLEKFRRALEQQQKAEAQ